MPRLLTSLPYLAAYAHLRSTPATMDQIREMTVPLIAFANDSQRLLNKCTKPDRKGKPRPATARLLDVFGMFARNRQQGFISSIGGVFHTRRHHSIAHVPRPSFKQTEFKKIAYATAIGFFMMGFIGFFVKLVHIPINNIIV